MASFTTIPSSEWPDSIYAARLKAGEWHTIVRPDGTPAELVTVEAGDVPCGPGTIVVQVWGRVYDWDEGNEVDTIGTFQHGFCASDLPYAATAQLVEEAGTTVLLEYSVERAAR